MLSENVFLKNNLRFKISSFWSSHPLKPLISEIILSQCLYKGGIKQFLRGISPRGQSLQDWQYSFYFLVSPKENERNFQYEHTYTYTFSLKSFYVQKGFVCFKCMFVILYRYRDTYIPIYFHEKGWDEVQVHDTIVLVLIEDCSIFEAI